MCVFVDILCKSGSVAIGLECVLVFVVSHCEIIILSVQRKLSYTPGMLICIVRTRKICRRSGSHVLGGYVRCY